MVPMYGTKDYIPWKSMKHLADNVTFEPNMEKTNSFVCFLAVVFSILFLLWGMYCLMYCVKRTRKRWNYEIVDNVDSTKI